MKREDLKTGMILEFNDKSRGLMLDNEIFLISKGGDFSRSRSRACLNERLEIHRYKNIVKIFVPNTPKNTNIGCRLEHFMFDENHMTLVWEIESVKIDMTIEQVQEKLGYKIKIVEGE